MDQEVGESGRLVDLEVLVLLNQEADLVQLDDLLKKLYTTVGVIKLRSK